jgi:DNA-binding transcriptional ArsR family regulator
MPDDGRPLPDVNRLVHEPARLAILTVLSACESTDFLFLQSATGLTKGNLSVQISRLEEAGMVRVEKRVRKKKMWTTISLATGGRSQVEAYWQTMDEIRKQGVHHGASRPRALKEI